MLVTIRGQMVDPLKPIISMHILHTVLYTFYTSSAKENLFNNQELLYLVIISSILLTLVLDSRGILPREIGC